MKIRRFALVLVPLAFVVVIVLGLTVSMTGSGSVGHVLPGWSVLESCTPAMPGDSRGSVGSASFKAGATATSRFVADNTVELSHSGGTFRGRISDVQLVGDEAAVSVAGPLQFLNVDKTMPPVWFKDTNSFLGFSYGSGTGQLATPFGIAVDPVDGGIWVTSNGTVDGVDRTRAIKYTAAGVYVTEIGSSGSGNGQFGATSMAIAVSPVDQAVWVTDAANSRIQKFTTADGGLTYAYSTKVGSAGSGNGQFGSTGVAYNIAADSSGNVYVTDRGNSRLQKFNSSAAYQAQVATGGTITPYSVAVVGSDVWIAYPSTNTTTSAPQGNLERYNTSLALQSTVTIPAPASLATRIGSIDGILNIAADPDGSLWASWVYGTFLVKYDTSGNEIARWQSLYPASTDSNSSLAVAAGSAGIYALFRPSSPIVNRVYQGYYVTGFDFDPVTLSAAIETYMGACDPLLNGYTLDYQAAVDPEVVFPGWSGNVWAKLKELFAIYGVELVRDDDTQTLIVRDQGSATATISNRTPITTQPQNSTGGRIVDVIYQNPVAGGGVVWDAEDANELISVEAGQTITRVLYTDNHPVELAQPVPTDTLPIQPGQFYVVDSTGAAITADVWTSSGASVSLAVGETPGTISATIVGPSSVLGGFTAPYYFATGRDPEDVPTLSIVGNGAFCKPTVLKRSGAQGSPFASPFMDTVDRALSRGHYPSLSDPTVEIRFTCAVSDLPAMGQAVGAIITYEQSKYRITEVKRGDLRAEVTAERFVTAADWTTTWSGEAASVYEVYWPTAGYSAGDEQVQPLRHA